MNLTPELSIAIEKYAGLFMSPLQVATICEIEVDLFSMQLKEVDSPIFKAYYKGYYTTVAELRETIIGQAKAGSSPAQTQAIKMMNDLLFEIKV